MRLAKRRHVAGRAGAHASRRIPPDAFRWPTITAVPAHASLAAFFSADSYHIGFPGTAGVVDLDRRRRRRLSVGRARRRGRHGAQRHRHLARLLSHFCRNRTHGLDSAACSSPRAPGGADLEPADSGRRIDAATRRGLALPRGGRDHGPAAVPTGAARCGPATARRRADGTLPFSA